MNSNPVLEELPVSPAARERIAEIAKTPYKGQLRKLGGLSLFQEVHAGNITVAEQEIILDEIAAREQILSVSPNQPPAETPEPPHDPEWSPTAILATLPPAEERQFDPRERAAGEYIDR